MAFGKVRHSQILSEAGNTWDVEIYKEGFSGTSVEFNMQGEGFTITWNGQGDTLDTQFLGSELTVNYYVETQDEEDFIYNEVLPLGDEKFYIRIFKTESGSTKKIWWFGWLTPAFDSIENSPFPYVVQLVATDSYGTFKARDKNSFYDYDDKVSYKKITEIIGYEDPPSGASANDFRGFMGRMNLTPVASDNHPAPVYINGGSSGDKTAIITNQIHWYRRNADDSIQDYNITYLPNDGSNAILRDPFFNYYFSKSAFAQEDAFDENDELIIPYGTALEYKESDVFDTVLKVFGAVGFLSEGSYIFRQPFNYKANTDGTVDEQKYRNASDLQSAISDRYTNSTSNDLLTIDQSTHVVLGGSSLNYESSYKNVSIDFNEGFSIATVEKGTLLDTRIGIGTLTSQDLGQINLSFWAEAIEVVNEPFRLDSSSTPKYSTSNDRINRKSVRTHSRLKITLLKSDGTRLYLQENAGSNTLTWTTNVTVLNIYRGLSVYSSTYPNSPLNDTNLMADSLNYSSINTVANTSDSSNNPVQNAPSGTRTTRTQIKFNCIVERPTVTGVVEIEMDSRNATTGDFTGIYQQFNNGNYTEFSTPPTFVSNETQAISIGFSYDDIEQGEAITSTVTYTADQTDTPSNKLNNLGTSVLGQTPISPLLSVAFRDATESSSGGSASTYPLMNETDKFNIKPCLTGFVRDNPGSPSPLNLLKQLTQERLNLQYKPLEVLQADIFSPTISPSKLVKYRINGDSGSYKYYAFKGGTFKAQSDTMSGEWFKVQEVTPTITTAVGGGFADPSIIIQENLALLDEKISEQSNSFQESISASAFTTTTAAISTKTTHTTITVVATTETLQSGQSIRLSKPDGTDSITMSLSTSAPATGTTLTVPSFTPDVTYPVGSLVRLNDVVVPTIEQVSSNRMKSKGTPGETGGTGPNDAGAVHTISDGAGYIHSQDIGDLDGTLYNSLNMRFYSGMGEGTDFDSSGASIPNDSNNRITGIVTTQSGELKNQGSGNITSGAVSLFSGDLLQSGSGDATSGNIIIRGGSAATSSGDSQSGSVTIQPGVSSSTSGTATKGTVQIGLADYITNILGTLTVSDIDVTSTAGQSLTITAGIYDNPVSIIGGDSKVYIRYQDNSTTGTNVIAVGAEGDNTYFRNDEGSWIFLDGDGPTTRLEITQTGKIIDSNTEIKILPRDFIADDGGRPLGIDDSSANRRFLESFSTNKMFASIEIPFGKKATDVIIYGSTTSAVIVYQADINSDVVTSKGTGNIGTSIDITDVSATSTNYILIELDQTSTEKVYGGKITIAKI